MKFAVTGGAGFIGSHLVEYLVSKGHSVVVIDNLHSGKIDNLSTAKDKIEFHNLSILDYDGLRSVIKNSEGVFHQAALTAVEESFEKPDEYYDINVRGTENMFKLAKEFGLKVVLASSSSVYGNATNIPITESFEKKPISPYGNTKLEDEYLAEKYSELGVDIIGLRYFNVYGRGQTSAYAGVITKFIENVRNHKPPIINGDGLQVRDFVYVGDVARANLLAMESKIEHGFFNIGSGVATSILILASMVIHSSGLSIKPIHNKALEGDIRLSQADISLAKNLLKWEPKTMLEDWLNQIIPKLVN